MALRTQSNRGKRRLMSDMNVVPYIDVMLVLVVILMVAAPFVNPSVVNLPSVKKAGKAPTENIQVVVHADSRLSIKTKLICPSLSTTSKPLRPVSTHRW
mgnify:CR=1 FL=1